MYQTPESQTPEHHHPDTGVRTTYVKCLGTQKQNKMKGASHSYKTAELRQMHITDLYTSFL
jgi:hypothetical protein